MRIISLVPSQTELLYHLGLGEEVVGITKFCIEPDVWFRTKTRVGGTKKIHFDRVEALAPDLILANKEENQKEDIERLAQQYPVWVSDIAGLEDALDMIRAIGKMTQCLPVAEDMIRHIRVDFQKWSDEKPNRPLSAAYGIWQEPFMVAGGDTFIDHMMKRAGFTNAFGDKKRYPVVSLDQMRAQNLDCLLLSSEPFPFREKHKQLWAEKLPGVRVVLVDGMVFSWYGSRLRESRAYFTSLWQQLRG